MFDRGNKMDINQLITTGVTSAIISSVISFTSGFMSLKYNKTKDRYNYIFTRLEELRRSLRGLNDIDAPVALDILHGHVDDSDIAKKITEQLRLSTNAFNICVKLFEDNKFCFTSSQRDRIDRLSHAVGTHQMETLDSIYADTEGNNGSCNNQKVSEFWVSLLKYIEGVKAVTDERLEGINIK